MKGDEGLNICNAICDSTGPPSAMAAARIPGRVVKYPNAGAVNLFSSPYIIPYIDFQLRSMHNQSYTNITVFVRRFFKLHVQRACNSQTNNKIYTP